MCALCWKIEDVKFTEDVANGKASVIIMSNTLLESHDGDGFEMDNSSIKRSWIF